MLKKICVRCSTENEEHYRFCKNCGATLPVVDQFRQTGYDFLNRSGENKEGQPSGQDFLYDTVTGAELAAYVGPGREKICEKFFSMELVGKKTSWHFPVFLLGILFGFFGMSFWFFARKMFKAGLILALIGAIFMVGDTAINLEANRALWADYQTVMQSALNVETEGDIIAISQQFEDAMIRYNTRYNPLVSGISNYIGSVFLPIIMGIFGLHFYKKSAIKHIKKIKERYPEDEFLMARIAASGGRKSYLALIPVAGIIICGFISVGIIFI